jgi:hypothetical protein
MDLFDFTNISIKVLEDACTSLHSQKHHEFAIDSLRHIIGEKNIVSLRELNKK